MAASVASEASVRAAADGTLSAQWNLLLDTNGRISGIRSLANGERAMFEILADIFRVTAPGAGVDEEAVFVVYTTPTVVNGITLPAGVYLRDAFVGTVNADRVVANTLSAISALLGSVEVGAGGAVRQGQTAYNTGVGFWLGDADGTPKFSIGNPAGNRLTWDGAELSYSGTLASFSVTIGSGAIVATVANGTVTYGTRTAVVTGGKAPFTYTWSVPSFQTDQPEAGASMWVAATGSPQTVGIAGRANNNSITGSVVCTVRDANGQSAEARIAVSVIHGFIP